MEGWRTTFLILYLLCSSHGQRIPPPTKVFPHQGILMEGVGDALLFNGHLSVPIVYNMPIVTPSMRHSNNSTQSCDKSLWMSYYLAQALSNLEKIIPTDVEFLDRDLNLKERLEKSALSTGDIVSSRSIAEKVNTIRQTYPNLSLSEEMRRHKRIVPLLILGAFAATGLGAALGGMIWNRVDIGKLQDQVTMLEQNQERISQSVKSLTATTNLLIDNQAKIHVAVAEIGAKMNELLSDYNCFKLTFHNASRVMDNWANQAPAAFIRALNGALLGKITVDLLPYESILYLLKGHPDLIGSIYQKNPALIYPLATFNLIQVTSRPPTIRGIAIIPLLSDRIFGHVYEFYRCPIVQQGIYRMYMLGSMGIHGISGDLWYTPEKTTCIQASGLYVCDKRGIAYSEDKCLTQMHIYDSTQGCSLSINTSPIKTNVFVTKTGILVCPTKKEIQLLSQDYHLLSQAKKYYPNNTMTFLTYDNATQLIINNIVYDLPRTLEPINVTTVVISPELIDSEHIERIKVLPGWHDIEHVRDLEPLMKFSPHHYGWIIGCGVLFVALICLIVWIRRSNAVQWKGIGYIFHNMQNVSRSGGPEIEECP